VKHLVLITLACALMAQTPAPTASTAPLRHLRYAFTADYQNLTEAHYDGTRNSTSGVATGVRGGGRKGTVAVDVVSIAPDGALVVHVSETLQNAPRAGETHTCMVYGNTSVLCPAYDKTTDAEWSLLSYLGREFVDGAPWDAQRHWQHKENTQKFDLTEDFTLTGALTDPSVVVHESKVMKLHDGDFEERIDDVQITYDRTMEIPATVHDEMRRIYNGTSSSSTFDFHLTSDSWTNKRPG